MKIFCLFFLLSLGFAGCASYQNKVAPAKSYLKNKNCPEAITSLEKLSTPTGADQLALLMEYGTALQICQKYEKSNQVFSDAENLANAVDYTSVSQVVGATLSNETVMTYKGDTFEKLFLNAAKALNYLQENKTDDALVEVRRMNQKFSKYKNEERKNYELNSFSKYLSGLIWESTGQLDDACIDYQDAYFTATQFREVGVRMLTTCWSANRNDEFNTLAKKINATNEEIQIAKAKVQKSELIFLFLQGWGPQKIESPSNPTFPALQNIQNLTQNLSAEIISEENLSSIGKYKSSTIYNVGDAARASLNADQASLLARRIASRVAKEVAANQIAHMGKDNEILGAAALLFMLASEQADLRQWSFLPNTIQIIRIPIPPGKYKVKLNGLTSSGAESEHFEDQDIQINKREKIIHIIRSIL